MDETSGHIKVYSVRLGNEIVMLPLNFYLSTISSRAFVLKFGFDGNLIYLCTI